MTGPINYKHQILEIYDGKCICQLSGTVQYTEYLFD